MAEGLEGLFSSVLRFVRQEIEQGLVGLGLAGGFVEIALVVDAVLGEESEGVIAEARVEIGEQSWGRGVGAHFINAAVGEVAGGDGGRVIGGFEEDLVDLSDDPAIGFGFLGDGLPFGVGEERFPRGVAGGAVGIGEHVNEFIVLVIERHPVTDVFDPVFGEELERMITEAGVEVVEFAGRRVIDADFKTARVFAGGLGEGRGG